MNMNVGTENIYKCMLLVYYAVNDNHAKGLDQRVYRTSFSTNPYNMYYDLLDVSIEITASNGKLSFSSLSKANIRSGKVIGFH